MIVTTKDIYGKEHKVDDTELLWRPSVYGVVIHDGNILLSKQFGSRYDLPGGGVDLTEGLEDAVVREVKEETGLNVKVRKLLGFEESYFTSSHDRGGAEHYHSLLFYYLCEYVDGEISADGFDEEEQHYAELAEWIPLDKLDNLDVASTVDYRKFIPKNEKSKT